jgi:hypothetical protein
MILNALDETVEFTLPSVESGHCWLPLIDTKFETGLANGKTHTFCESYHAESHSFVLMILSDGSDELRDRLPGNA